MDIKVTQRRSRRSRRSPTTFKDWPMSHHTSEDHNRQNQNWSRLYRRNLMPGTSLDITQRPSPELPERGLRPSARYIRSRTSEHRAPPTHPLKPTRKHPVHQVRLQNNILNPQLKSDQITTRSKIIFPLLFYFPNPNITKKAPIYIQITISILLPSLYIFPHFHHFPYF